ncbi:uncharacterized protein LOC121253514 [Juglans microcarpa x Juglans regia]|uniref:uncharacterized protein LOC121253514 n=1 Tax=Juglans microcarpa x Juglans regia TaxID=2249226 RepID=UPI001B7E9766|nr:uncharacterized protein LOC121253514 [Juglans microcarpa x Juglans regia]
MAEELSKLWEGFNLTDIEKEVVNFSAEDISRAEERAKKCLLICILMDKNLNKEAFKTTMSKIWNPEGAVSFTKVGYHKFLVELQKAMDIERVKKGTPWSFHKNLIYFKEFDSKIPLSEVVFTHEPFWLQLHGLPPAAMIKKGGERISSAVGDVLNIEVDEDGIGWGKFLRIRVMMDITKPLPRGKMIKVDGKQRWIEFKYERLPLFYFPCGAIQHDSSFCARGNSKIIDKREAQSQYGQWLRATGMNLMGNGGKGRGFRLPVNFQNSERDAGRKDSLINNGTQAYQQENSTAVEQGNQPHIEQTSLVSKGKGKRKGKEGMENIPNNIKDYSEGQLIIPLEKVQQVFFNQTDLNVNPKENLVEKTDFYSLDTNCDYPMIISTQPEILTTKPSSWKRRARENKAQTTEGIDSDNNSRRKIRGRKRDTEQLEQES